MISLPVCELIRIALLNVRKLTNKQNNQVAHPVSANSDALTVGANQQGANITPGYVRAR
jgi:hypothetical protein